ncbi:MAG: hypothetical protein AAF629_00505 [Chloroflexota bacterium]
MMITSYSPNIVSEAKPPLTVEWIRICAWCQAVIGREVAQSPQGKYESDQENPHITHGICEACSCQLRRDLSL